MSFSDWRKYHFKNLQEFKLKEKATSRFHLMMRKFSYLDKIWHVKEYKGYSELTYCTRESKREKK